MESLLKVDETREYEGIAVRIRVCLDVAWLTLQSMDPLILAVLNSSQKASVLHGIWTARIDDEFGADPSVIFADVRGLKHLNSETFRVRFKKVGRYGRVSDNRTKQSNEWKTMPVPGITKQISMSFVYRPDPMWLRIETAGLQVQVNDQVLLYLEVGPEMVEEDTSTGATPASHPSATASYTVRREVIETRQKEFSNGRLDIDIGT